ncbi:MAG: hypothetical protein E6G60_08930, partial [Actinobacteria bacterium]
MIRRAVIGAVVAVASAGVSSGTVAAAASAEPRFDLVDEWTRQLPNPVSYPPLVVDDLLIAVATPEGAGASTLYGLDRMSGTMRFERALPARIEAAPIEAGPLVIVRFENASLLAIDAHNGDVRWQAPIGSSAKGPAPPVASFSGLVGTRAQLDLRPDDSLYVGSQHGDVRRLRLLDGKLLWRRKLPMAALAPPELTGGLVYVGVGELPFGPKSKGALYALDPDTGRVRWHRGVDGPVMQPPTIAPPGVAFVATHFGGTHARDDTLWALDRSGGVAFRAQPGGKLTRPLAHAANIVVASSSGSVRSFHPRQGMSWQTEIGASQSAGLISAEPDFVATGSAIVGLDGGSGKTRWRVAAPNAVIGTPSGVVLPLSSSLTGELVIVDSRDGTVLGRRALHDTGRGDIASDRRVYHVDSGGTLHAFRLDPLQSQTAGLL